MPTKKELRLAAQIVLRGLIDRAEMEACLAEMDGGRRRGLEEVLIATGRVTPSVLGRLKLEMAMEAGEVRDLVPGYRISGKIGEGGMSWVYKALHEERQEWVALKILRPRLAGEERLVARFIREARLLRRLDHPNVVRGYSVGRIRGLYLFSMEYVEGGSLLWYIDRKMAFNEDAALYVILQIARALEYLRERSIIHRDIKPGNILLTRDNTVKLCDLGLAAETSSDEDAKSDTTVGTVEYLSPEQARGHRDLDVRSDIYSLGVTLYHLVLGQLPFDGSDNHEIMARQILESMSSPEVKSKVSPHMHYFIEKMMAKERELRYQDPLELIRDIEAQIVGRKSLTYNPTAKGDATRIEKPFEERVARPAVPIARNRGGDEPADSRVRARKRAEIRERLRIKRIKKKRTGR